MENNLGSLAYYDILFNGLVPCKVTGIRVYNEHGHYEVYFTVTATRGPYKRGDKLFSSPLHVVPRAMVTIRRGRIGIKTGYFWRGDECAASAYVRQP
jgi:hypothetical protein